MKLLRILSRNIRDASKSVLRNFNLSIASISCITITLIIVSISLILSYNAENVTKLIRRDFTIVAFLDNKVTAEQTSNVETRIRSISNISEYKYQSKQEIAASMKDSSEVFKTIMENWKPEDNPLQDTYLIKVKDATKISATAKKIQNIEGVTVVRYGEGIVEKLLSTFKIVEKFLVIAVAALVLVTAFLIANTIKLTIFSRRKEIEIMRLVGASNLNIKLPFIVEGLFLGVLGSIIPILLIIYGYTTLFSKFDGRVFTPFLQLVNPEPFIYIISLILLCIGILVGMWGSSRAVKKHLKV
jgi:cell division transport system permease protein